MIPLTAVVNDDDTIYINQAFCGSAKVRDVRGKEVTLVFDSDYPTNGACKITIHCDEVCSLKLKLRRPAWCDKMIVNGTDVQANGYYDISGNFCDNDEIQFDWKQTLRVHRLNEKVAFTYGAITLACDMAKSDRDIKAPVEVSEEPIYHILETKEDELVRIECETTEGRLLLTDYQSCGKDWLQEKNIITVWLNTK